MTIVLYRRRASTRTWKVSTGLLRAFDKAVRRKPVAVAADAFYGNCIDFWLETVARNDLAKTLVSMVIDVRVPAFMRAIVALGG